MGCGVVSDFIKDRPLSPKEELEDISTDYAGAGVLLKQIQIPAGYRVVQHKHRYPHLSILQSGRVQLVTDAGTREMVGPDSVVIEANLNHMIIAHTDAMWLCVHAGDSFEIA